MIPFLCLFIITHKMYKQILNPSDIGILSKEGKKVSI